MSDTSPAADNRAAARGIPRRALCGALLVVAIAVATAGCATPRPKAFVRAEAILPLRSDTVPVTVLQLGPDAPARVLVDTGSETSGADDLFAAEANLTTKSYLFPRRLRGIGWTRSSTSYALIDPLPLGEGAEVRRVALQLIDLRNLPVPGRGGDEMAQVLLGANVLRELVTIFDARAGELVIVPPGNLTATLARRYPGVEFVTMRVDWTSGTPHVRLAGPDGDLLPMLLDTGAEISVIGETWIERFELPPDDARLRELVAPEVADQIGDDSPFRRVDGLTLGPRRLAFTAVRTRGKRGILGNDVLRTFPFALDGPRSLIVFPAR